MDNNKKSGNNIFRHINYNELNISQKISFLLSVVSFTAVVIVGVTSFFSSKRSLKDVAMEHMTSITEMKKNKLEDYFKLARNQIRVFAQDQMVVEAMQQFKDAFNSVDFDASENYSFDDFQNMKASVENYYNTNVISQLNKNLNTNYTVESFLSDNRKTTFLQYIYIADNPNPMTAKFLLNKTSDGTAYSDVHGRYHKNFRDFAEKFEFEDVYLMDKERNNIVYSVSKKIDFGANILENEFKETQLAHAYEMAKDSKVRDYNYLSDMGFYGPSLGQPSAFISAPVYDESGMLGVIVFQISGNTINNTINADAQWESEGLGETGETYLVGDDYRMRSDNRLIYKDKNKYIESLDFLGFSESDIDKVNKLNTNILTTKVETEAAREVMNGRSDQIEVNNYMGEKVLSAYAPVNIKDVNWGVITEIQTSEIYKPIHTLRNIIILIIVLLLLIVFFIGKYLSNLIAERITIIKDSIDKLASGQTISKMKNESSDEIGLTAISVNQLVERLDEVSNFANAIGKGDFSYDYKASSSSDKLGNSLLEMKKSLEDAREEEKRRMVEDEKRNWSTQGIAKFGEILRSNNDNLDKLSYEIISNLVNYLNSNQGGIFLIEGEDEEDPHINLMASYAYNRRKFIKKRIEMGEGLIGTCVLEKKTIHLTEIPDDYINITSGLGDANPDSILIVPLKSEDIVLGVIEIATFEKYEAHEIDFVEKLADSIASTITSVRINAKTAKLLEESNERANQMAQQEEEMRQNLEELKATQEEMNRIKKEEEKKEEERRRSEELLMSQLQEQNDFMKEQAEKLKEEKALLDAVLNNLPDSIYFKDLDSKFIKVSKSQANSKGVDNPEEMIGKSDFDFHGDAAKPKFEAEQEIIKTGKGIIDLEEEDKNADGTSTWYSTTKLPLVNEDGECIGTFGISKDVTEFKNLEIEANQKNEELQAQEEEMRQNLEEMQTIQEELSKRTYLMDSLLENLPEHIYFKDLNSKFIEASTSMTKLMGVRSKDDLIGKSDFDFFDDEHAKPAFEDEQNIIKTGIPIINKIEKEVRKDGRVTYAATTKLPLKNEQGKIVGTFGISKDVTDSKTLEEQLAHEKLLLDALLDNLPATIYFKDTEGKFIRISTSLVPKFKVDSMDKIIGKSDFDFHGKKHAQEAFEDELRIMKTKKPVIDIIEKEEFDDGRVSWGATSKMPLMDKDGNVIGTFGITSDVTKLMVMKEELDKLKDAKEELNKIVEMKEELNKLRKGKK